MICPSCGYDNIEGTDRCEECTTSLFNLDDSQGGRRDLARSVMEDDLSHLEREFLAVSPDSSVTEVINQMKQARLGCALVLEDGKVVGIFTERDLLNKLTGKTAPPPTVAVKELMSPNPEVLRETDSSRHRFEQNVDGPLSSHSCAKLRRNLLRDLHQTCFKISRQG